MRWASGVFCDRKKQVDKILRTLLDLQSIKTLKIRKREAYGMLPPTGCISQNRFGWPKSHRRQGSRDEHQHLDRIHEMKYFIFIIGTFDFFKVFLKNAIYSVRPDVRSKNGLKS